MKRRVAWWHGDMAQARTCEGGCGAASISMEVAAQRSDDAGGGA